MSCVLTTGFSIPCRGISGVQKAFIGTWNGPTLTYVTDTDGTIGTFSAGTGSYYAFNQTIETASYTFPATVNNENNAIAYAQTLMLTLNGGLTQAIVNEIKTLGQGVWRVVILDKGGNYWMMGITGPVQVSALDGGLGKASTDLSGATLTFTATESVPITAMSAYAASQLIV